MIPNPHENYIMPAIPPYSTCLIREVQKLSAILIALPIIVLGEADDFHIFKYTLINFLMTINSIDGVLYIGDF